MALAVSAVPVSLPEPLPPLVTLAEVKAYLGVTHTEHDAELTRLINQASGVVAAHAGPTAIVQTFTETLAAGAPLSHYPVHSIASVTGSYYGTDATDVQATLLDPSAGTWHATWHNGPVTVTYVAGLANTPPPEFVDAALVFVSYKYRRNHGGSESFMPAGADGSIAPPMGTTALRQQIELALGRYAAGPSVA